MPHTQSNRKKITISGKIDVHNQVIRKDEGHIIRTLKPGENATDKKRSDELIEKQIRELEEYKKRLEKSVWYRTEEVEFIAKTAMELVELPLEKDVYEFIGEKLSEMVGDCVVGVNSINENKTLEVRSVVGLGEKKEALINKILGRKTQGMILDNIPQKAINSLTSGKLVRLDGGLYGLLFGQIPKAACKAIEKIMDFREVYSIGLRREGRLFGNASIFVRKSSRINKKLIETFMNQASVALERKEAFERLRELDKMKDDFLASTSHSLMTPVTSIISLSELLGKELGGEVDDEQVKDLATITKESKRLKKLIENILHLSRLEGGKIMFRMKGVGVKTLLEHSIAHVKTEAEDKNISIETKIPKRLPKIRVSYERMEEVLINLLDNAIKFTNPGGIISVGARREKNNIILWVRDMGPGIGKSEFEKIFTKFYQIEPFSKSSTDSFGLGLVISKKIVKAHGGVIWVESKLGEGSTFYVSLHLN